MKIKLISGIRSHRFFLPVIAALVSFILFPVGLFAQVNFAGSWVINESKSNFGDGPRFSPSTITVAQQPDLITMELVQPSFDGGDTKLSEKYTIDGKESVNQGMMNSVAKTITAWSDDRKGLKFDKTITFDMNGDKMEMKSVEIWKLSDDGKTLTINQSFSSQMGEMNITSVYDKK